MTQATSTDSLKASITTVTNRRQQAQRDFETPPNIAAIRLAANLPAIESHENWQQLASRTLADLSRCLGFRYSRERSALEKFQVYHPAQSVVVARVKAFVNDLGGAIGNGKSLVLYGVVGTGKDHLLAAAMYAAAAATVPVRWVSGQEIYGRIRDSMDTGEREELLMADWERPAILGISDPIPPIGKPSEWNTAQFYRLLDRRYRAMKCTWVSLNAVSLEDADGKLSAPVFDRLREGAELIPCFWPSFRERKS